MSSRDEPMMDASVSLLGVKGGPAIRPGSSMPTSLLVRMAGQVIVVDAGLGVARGICDQGVPLTGFDLIVITHLHSDHYLELGPLLHTAWVAGRTKPVRVVGPKGLEDYWRHFCAAMDFDISLREAHEGRVPFAGLAEIVAIDEGVILDDGALVVRAMRNDHPPITDSFALRFDAGGKSLVLSGDTAPMDAMADFARGADLLVHECMLRDGVEALVARMTNGDERLRSHILGSHTEAADAGAIAAKAGVGALALNHFVPDGDPDFPPERYVERVRTTWAGPLHVGGDGLTITF